MEKKVKKVLKERINPILFNHGGEAELVKVENDIVVIKFKGACANCPSASNTLEETVSIILKDEIPRIKGVKLNQGVSEELIGIAKNILRNEF